MGIGEGGGWRHLSPLGSFWGLSPSRSPTLASHPLPNPNSSSPASRALSSITNNNDAYQIAWTYPTSSEPAPALPRGPLPRTRAFGVGGRISGARQAGLDTALYTPLCIRFAGKAPWGGVADASGFFLYLYVIFMNGLHSGQGRGAAAPILPADARGLGCPGSLSPPLNPAPPGLRLLGASGPASQRPVPSLEPQAPPSLCCQLTPVYAKASAATPPQGPAPLAAAFVTSLHAAPPTSRPFPGLPAPCPS